MRTLLITIICILILSTALGLASAVWIGLRRNRVQADPFCRPFGEMPGFTDEQLRQISRRSERRIARDPLRRSLDTVEFEPSAGPALRARNAGGGDQASIPSWVAAARDFFGSHRHA